MKEQSSEIRAGKAGALSTHLLTEETARRRFNQLLNEQHALGSRQPKGRSVYQVVCDQEGRWVALFLWTGACWHLRPRDEWIGWDPVLRSERLQLIGHQARFLILEKARDSHWASSVLAASLRDLPTQWEDNGSNQITGQTIAIPLTASPLFPGIPACHGRFVFNLRVPFTTLSSRGDRRDDI